jgi:hypothetical protein
LQYEKYLVAWLFLMVFFPMTQSLSKEAFLNPATGAYIAAVARALSQQAEFCVDGIESCAKGSSGPFFAVMGEVHDQSLHGLFHLLVGLGLQDRGYKVAIGLERPHNNAKVILDSVAQQAPSDLWDSLRQRLDTTRRDDGLHHRIVQSFSLTQYNNQQGKVTCGLWQEAGIPVAFNDAACSSIGEDVAYDLDMTDPVTQRVLSDAGITISPDEVIPARSPKGIYYRNLVMTALAQEHALETGTDFYIQIGGAAHVTGTKDNFLANQILPYRESLVALLEEKLPDNSLVGIPVLSKSFNESALPHDMGPNIAPPTILEGPGFHASHQEEELLWLNEILPKILSANRAAFVLDNAKGPLAPQCL